MNLSRDAIREKSWDQIVMKMSREGSDPEKQWARETETHNTDNDESSVFRN